jgi:hypothetical protein
MLSIDNTTEMITALAQEHITEAIVNAAKGKTTNKRSKKISLSDEIKSCFDIEKFLNNAAATIEELILRKVEEALSAAATTEKPKKRAPAKKKEVVTEPEVTEVNTEIEAISSEEAKPKKKRVAKKTTVEASVQASTDSPVEIEQVVEVSATTVTEVEAPKPKEKKSRVTKKVTTVEPTVEAPKPNEKKRRVTKKDKPVEVSDSDASDSEKPKKKRVIKKVTTPVLPVADIAEAEVNAITEEVIEQIDQDDSSVATSDFIRPISISDELEEEELSDIEDE